MNQFKKFCTGSEKNCTKGKIELQHIHYKALENNPKQIRTLIGLKPCFYNSIETQN